MPRDAIHIAHCISRRGGVQYRARAHVKADFGPGDLVKLSQVIAIGDTAQEAEAEALDHLRAMYRRDGIELPAKIVRHGRMSAALVDNHSF